MIEKIGEIYSYLSGYLPEDLKFILPLTLLSFSIALYGIIIWNYYRFLAKKDIISLDLAKYNHSEHKSIKVFFAAILYAIEYLIIMPFIVFFWFSVLAILMVILAKDYDIFTVMLISGAIIGATRISSYYNEDLSKDIAKMFPFTLLGVVLLTPGFFDLNTTLERFSQIPLVLNHILYFAIFIFILELFFRLITFFSKDDDSSQDL